MVMSITINATICFIVKVSLELNAARFRSAWLVIFCFLAALQSFILHDEPNAIAQTFGSIGLML